MSRWKCDLCGKTEEAPSPKVARAELAHHYANCPEYSRVEF